MKIVYKNEDPFSYEGIWLKGNIHSHSTNSDGIKSPEELVKWYKDIGYDFLSITDHDTFTNPRYINENDLILIPGLEVEPGPGEHVDEVHILAWGVNRSFGCSVLGLHGVPRCNLPLNCITKRLTKGAKFVAVAHPYYSNLTEKDFKKLKGIRGIEIYNSTAEEENGRGDSRFWWDRWLSEGWVLWGFASDDTHDVFSFGKMGWIMVKVKEKSPEEILDAVSKGRFYSSQGPTIYDFKVTKKEIYIKCSPVTKINLITHGRGGDSVKEHGDSLTECSFPLKHSYQNYLRVECIDKKNRYAWTQPVWIEK